MNCKLITWNEKEFFINEVLFVGVVIFAYKEEDSELIKKKEEDSESSLQNRKQ